MVPVRDELLEWIASEALGGDRDTAEWVLLASLARVYVLAQMQLILANMRPSQTIAQPSATATIHNAVSLPIAASPVDVC